MNLPARPSSTAVVEEGKERGKMPASRFKGCGRNIEVCQLLLEVDHIGCVRAPAWETLRRCGGDRKQASTTVITVASYLFLLSNSSKI
jgi:hypothetical protein